MSSTIPAERQREQTGLPEPSAPPSYAPKVITPSLYPSTRRNICPACGYIWDIQAEITNRCLHCGKTWVEVFPPTRR